MTPALLHSTSRDAPLAPSVVRRGAPGSRAAMTSVPAPATEIGPLLIASESDHLMPGALRFAELLARRERVNAHLLARVPPVHVHRAMIGHDDAQALQEGQLVRRRKQLRRLLHETVGRSRFFSTGVAVDASERVFETVARERGAEWIFVGLDHPGAPDRMINERSVLEIVRMAEVPVLAVPRSGAILPVRALALVDGSAGSLRAARAAARLLETGARLTLAHVAPAHVAPAREEARRGQDLPHTPEGTCTARQLESLAAELAALSGTDVDIVWLEGEPAAAVLAYAGNNSVDLIASGMSDGSPYEGWHPATSAAAALLKGASQAVLIARASPRRVPAALVDGVDGVDEAGMDSFPASDPPSWSPLRVGAPRDAR